MTGGVAFTGETYAPVFDPEDGASTTVPSRRSMEGFIGTELNMYDIGDLNLLTTLVLYLTIISDDSVEPVRIRTDFRFDAKYDDFIVKDLYIPGVHISGSRPKYTPGDSFLLLIDNWR